MKLKKRLDVLLQERYPAYSRQQLQSWIMQGKVAVEGKVVSKPGMSVLATASIALAIPEAGFVSRAGVKLDYALTQFDVDVTGLIALDAGLSTGGFTDCLLQRGVHKVYGVDVGYGQVHEKIRNDPRVEVIERTNLRTLDQLPELADMATLDLSFISVLKVMPAVSRLLKPQAQLIVLIKPQFEALKEEVGRGGLIMDASVHERVVQTVVAGIEQYAFACKGVVESPITGSSGNKEFLGFFRRLVDDK